jgi:uncharacterized protein YgbK (DUF1537 family)
MDDLWLTFAGDDFTGSVDALEALTRLGIETILFLDPPSPDDLAQFDGVKAVGVASVARTMSPQRMDEELRAIFIGLRDLGAPITHYKMCSTFDSSPQIGSIGRAIDIGYQVFDLAFVPLLVGAPRLGRYTAFGNHFARSGWDSDVFRLDRHPTMQHHPITPMNESDLARHLAHQTDKSIALFDLLQLAPPMEAIEERFAALLANNPQIVIFDIIYDDQLTAIGHLMWDRASKDDPLFAVGSAGIEYALTGHWDEIGLLPPQPDLPYADSVEQLLVMSGSASPVTADQMKHALDAGFAEVEVQTAELVKPDRRTSAIHDAAEKARGLLLAGESVIVHIVRGPDDPRMAQTKAQFTRMGYSDLDILLNSGQVLGEALGEIMREIVHGSNIQRALVCGGDTSSYVARHLGVRALQMKAPFLPAMPICRVFSDKVNNLELAFKGGQVGKMDLFSAVKRGKP